MIISDNEAKRCLSLIEAGGKSGATVSAHYVLRRYLSDDQISPKVVQTLLDALNSMPATRGNRVDDVKDKVQDATYPVASEEIAAKIIGRAISDKVR
jgi:hypothetical protein